MASCTCAQRSAQVIMSIDASCITVTCLSRLQRMSMADIKQHPWFQHHLPEGALAMNDWYLTKQPNAEQVRASHLSGCILEQ